MQRIAFRQNRFMHNGKHSSFQWETTRVLFLMFFNFIIESDKKHNLLNSERKIQKTIFLISIKMENINRKSIFSKCSCFLAHMKTVYVCFRKNGVTNTCKSTQNLLSSDSMGNTGATCSSEG